MAKNLVAEKDVFDDAEAMENPTFYPSVHVMIRWISRSNISAPDLSYQNYMEVDAEVGAWLLEGYKLINTHFLGENPEAFGVMFILAKQGA